MAEITCKRCDAYYNSERELRDHMQAVHRIFRSENSARPAAAELKSSTSETTEKQSYESVLASVKEEMAAPRLAESVKVKAERQLRPRSTK
jgi:hypothetical protein